MEDFFQEGLEEFVKYEKNMEIKKTKGERRRKKEAKLVADMNDPVQKKMRSDVRRKAEKEKKRKAIEGMNEEEAKQYLRMKSYQKKQLKIKLLQAVEVGQPILIDNVYEQRMCMKENKSLAVQLDLIMKAIQHIENPPGIHICSVSGSIKEQLQKMGYQYWTASSTEQNVVEVAQGLGKKIVYLSPDAKQDLEDVSQDTAYIIGGLVDRTVIKNASLERAKELNVEARCLPIKKFMKSRQCLNLDHVVKILCRYREVKDWKEAFDHAAPKRWKRDANGKEQSSSSESEEEKQKEIKKEQEDTYEVTQELKKESKEQTSGENVQKVEE